MLEARAPDGQTISRAAYQWQKSLLTTKNVSSSFQYSAKAALTASRELAGGCPTSSGMSLRSSRLQSVENCDCIPLEDVTDVWEVHLE